MIGQTISHYRIVSKLGEGGMGTVYAAEDMHLGRRVAIKFLNASRSDHHYRARFLLEARSISSFTHPNIATVFDYGETEDEKPYFVMELVEGETLGDLLEVSALTLWRAVEIIECVADALSEAHDRGIVHRDIKPTNVIITERGQVKVLDFGLAKRIEEEEYRETDPNAQTLIVTHTREGIVVGTPLYLSPEQATGAKVDGRSDIFALGALLYECTSGKPAFSGGSVIEIGAQIIHVNPAAPSTINPQIPPELDRITLKALAKKPEDRYQTAEEMRQDLAAAHSLMSTNGGKIKRIKQSRRAGNRTSALTTITEKLRKPRISVFTLAAYAITVSLVVVGILYILRPKPYQPSKEALKAYEMGTDFLRLGSYHQASKSLEKAVNIDPNFALAHARLAEAWTELDDSDRAKDELIRANNLVRNRNAVTKSDGLYLDAINAIIIYDFDKAIDCYQQIVNLTPDKPEVYVDLGRAYEKNGQVDKAIESYVEATKRDMQYPLAYLRVAVMYIRRQEVPSATSALDRADNLYDEIGNIEGRTETLNRRGAMLNETGKLPEAQEALQHAFDMAVSTGNARQKFNATLQMSRVAFSKGEVVKASEYANDARNIAQQQGLSNLVILALLDLGNAYNGWGDFEKAEAIFRQALELSQRNRALRFEALSKSNLGATLMQRFRNDEGFPLIEQSLEYFRKVKDLRQVSMCLTYVGREHRRKGEYGPAVDAYKQKLEIGERGGDLKEQAFAMGDMAMSFAKQERYPEALAKYDESNEIDRPHQFSQGLTYNQMNRSSILWQLGRYDDARASLDEASRLANEFKVGIKAVLAEVQLILAQIALSKRDFATAKKFSLSAIEQAGTHYPDVAIGAKITLGSALALSGASADGKRICEEALQMARATGSEAMISDAMLAYAMALYERDEIDEALNYALAVQERLARSGEQESEWRAWLLAGQCSIRKGEREQGRERFQRARGSLTSLQQQWGAEVFDRYQKRPDIQFSLKQLSDALSAVP